MAKNTNSKKPFPAVLSKKNSGGSGFGKKVLVRGSLLIVIALVALHFYNPLA
jgi:hypothetical protein